MNPPKNLPGSVHVLFTTREARAAVRALEAAQGRIGSPRWLEGIANKIKAAAQPERTYRSSPAKPADENKCVVCGCTQDHACEGGCWWVAPDLCSACDKAWSDAVYLVRKLYSPRNRGWGMDRRTVEAARVLRKFQDDALEAVTFRGADK